MNQFLETFAGCLTALVTLWIFAQTVWLPLSRWLAQRAHAKSGAPPFDDAADGMTKTINASQALHMAAVDATEYDDDEVVARDLLAAARTFRAALPPWELERLRHENMLRHMRAAPPAASPG